MKRWSLVTIVITLLALLISGCASQPPAPPATPPPPGPTGMTAPDAAGNGLMKGMAALDQAYIPALVTTNQGKAAESKAAMAALNAQWQIFKQSFANYRGQDPQWGKDLESVEAALKQATASVEAGKLTEAHEQLEPIRDTMVQLRKRNNFEYYIDRLNTFHEPMEAIVLLAENKKPEEINVEGIKSLLPKAKTTWQAVLDGTIDPVLFGLDQAQLDKIASLKNQETAALSELEKSLAGQDKAAIAKAALAIKPPYSALFAAFGKMPAMPAAPATNGAAPAPGQTPPPAGGQAPPAGQLPATH